MKQCEICGKKPVSSYTVSHANNHTKRRLLPNLQNVRALVDGQAVSMRVCTRCIRSNAVVKAPRNLGNPALVVAK